LPNPKGPPSSLVQLRVAVWTGYARVTRPGTDIRPFFKIRDAQPEFEVFRSLNPG
jgi:hypothetical protein